LIIFAPPTPNKPPKIVPNYAVNISV